MTWLNGFSHCLADCCTIARANHLIIHILLILFYKHATLTYFADPVYYRSHRCFPNEHVHNVNSSVTDTVHAFCTYSSVATGPDFTRFSTFVPGEKNKHIFSGQ